MNKRILVGTLAGTLAFAMAGQVGAVETFEIAGQEYVVTESPAEEGKVIDEFEIAGQKYVIREAVPGETEAEMAIFEVVPGVDEMIYADDDPYIVITGAR